ncbi:MAG: hypothetical protein QME96_17560, partial [Myxococcota bacterium]|nr:hypothetical protein [Myxococcota bacterium]
GTGTGAGEAEGGAGWSGGFLGGDDDAVLEVICDSRPIRWEMNRGGTTIHFRAHFEGGSSALFKPEQAAAHSKWQAEVATYRLSRFLGIHRVPPSCEVEARREDLTSAEGVTAAFRTRLEAEVPVAQDGAVRGMMMYWVPHLHYDEIALEGDWREWLEAGARIPPGRLDDAAALSDLLLLDWLALNPDRWTGGNVRRAGSTRGPLVFIDNAAGFGSSAWVSPATVWSRFRITLRFRRGTVEALRRATDESLHDLLGDILTADQREALGQRRDEALRRIDWLIERLGADKVLFFE